MINKLCRAWAASIAALCLCGCIAGLASAAAPAPPSSDPSVALANREYDVAVRINGRAIDAPFAGYLSKTNNTVYVSARMVAEALGMKASWNAKKNLAELTTQNGQVFAFPLARTYFWFNGQRYFLPSGTEVQPDGTRWGFYVMLPAEAVGSLFGAKVEWDDGARRLDIAKADGSVPEDVSRSFAREWDLWNPNPDDSLKLAGALFSQLQIDKPVLKITVPDMDGVTVVYYKGSAETTLQPGTTYTYKLGVPNAGIYAYRVAAGGAIDEAYWIWVDPGSPNFLYGIYGGQGADVLVQDEHSRVATPDRIREVVANAGKMQSCGTVAFKGAAATVQLPLNCVKADYGADEPGRLPVSRPHSSLPAVSFGIPEGQQSQLAAYWMNRDSSGGEDGVLFIGPRGWRVSSAGVGADGSVGLALQSPEDPRRQLTLTSIPGCQGCAISAIGTYFPSLREWAEAQAFPGSDLDFAELRAIDSHANRYTLSDANPGLTTEGVARERHDGDSAFAGLQLTVEEKSRNLAETILDFAAGTLQSWL